MNMNRWIRLSLMLVLAAGTHPALAQNQGRPGGQALDGRLSGTVLDADTSEPIASATVAVWAVRDSSLVTGAITKDDGTFEVEGLRGGQFYVKLSFIGYVTETVSDVALRPGAGEVDLGTIRLAADARMMDEVEVSAERDFMEVQIDRTVYNTKDQLTSLGGTASDVLGNIPSVEVDIDGNLSLRGSQNVAVLLNGKPAPMQGQSLVSFLQGLPADAVERIEVIPNPSAKYEPDGMSGILNIVLKQNQNLGFGGGISLSAATQDDYNASGNVSFQKGPVSIFTSYGFRYGSRDGEGWRYREDLTPRAGNPVPGTYPILDQDSFDDNSRLSNTLNTSIDYSLSKQNTLSLSGLWSYRGGDQAGLTSYLGYDTNEAFLNRFNRQTAGDGTDFNMDYRLSFSRIITPRKHELTAEVRYEQEWEDDFERFTQVDFTSMEATDGSITGQERNDQKDRNRETSAQIDYVRPFGEDVRLEGGYKGSLENLHSDFYADTLDLGRDVFLPDESRNNTFVYDQQIHAAYGIIAAEIGKVGLQGGVRLEQALTDFTLETTGEAFDNNYFSVFPSAFATYKFSDARSVKLSYSKRINRPSTGGWFNQLNPFTTNEDPFFRRVGNPRLKPEYIHAFESSFTQLLGTTTLTLTPYFRRTVDVIRFVETIDDAGVTDADVREPGHQRLVGGRDDRVAAAWAAAERLRLGQPLQGRHRRQQSR